MIRTVSVCLISFFAGSVRALPPGHEFFLFFQLSTFSTKPPIERVIWVLNQITNNQMKHIGSITVYRLMLFPPQLAFFFIIFVFGAKKKGSLTGLLSVGRRFSTTFFFDVLTSKLG
jgi:hypothetical protein